MTRLLFAVLCVAGLSVLFAGQTMADIEGSTNGYNTFIGHSAGSANTSENACNTFIGAVAGAANTTGSDNTFVGRVSGVSNLTGSANSFFGSGSGYLSSEGHYNTMIGLDSGFTNTTGGYNTFVGSYAGYGEKTGDRNVFLGYSAAYGVAEDTHDRLYIDNCYINSGSPDYSCTFPLIYGEFDNRIVKIYGQVIMSSSSSASDGRYKKDIEPLKASLDKVMKLNGVSYKWKMEGNPGSGFSEGRQIGLVAQDVERVLPELVYTDSKGYKSLAYDKLVPVLVEALKEQEGEIRELKEKLGRLDRLEAKINKLESKDVTARK
jgi:trimeric autotransporter adhesin